MPAPPTIEPDASPTVCIELNESWVSWLQGRVWNMEFLDWSDPWDDAAIIRSSRLADLLVGAECNGGAALEVVHKRLQIGVNVTLNSATLASIGSGFSLNINPTANARYLVSFFGPVRNTSGAVNRMDWYFTAGGIQHDIIRGIYHTVTGIARVYYCWQTVTQPLPAGATIIDYQYIALAGSCFLEAAVSGNLQTWHLNAVQVA